MPTDNKLLALNQALAIFQSGKEVDDVDVDIAVFTNLTSEHLDFHGD